MEFFVNRSFLKDAADKGLLTQTEFFVFTDNFASESTFYKGTSSSKKVFELMFALRELQMNVGLSLHVLHVTGKRMISQGTDGLSCGSMATGVMAGLPLLSFVPLHLSAMDHEGPNLKEWTLSWFSGADAPLFLSHDDWFLQGHKHSTCI